MKEVKAVPDCGNKNETLEGQRKHGQPKVKLRLFKTSAATIGLIASIGTPNLLLTTGSDRVPAVQTPSEGESATNQAAPTLETVQGANNLGSQPQPLAVQIAPASAPIEVMPAVQPQVQAVIKSDRLAERLKRREAAKAKLQQYAPAPAERVEAKAVPSTPLPEQNYRAPAPQIESAASVVQPNIEPVETIAATSQPATPQVGDSPTDSRVNRLVARLKANRNTPAVREKSHFAQSPSVPEPLAEQQQPVIANKEANSAWTAKQRLLVERLKQKEQSSQLSSASETTPVVSSQQPQTATEPIAEPGNEQKALASNDSVVVEAQLVQPTTAIPETPAVAVKRDRPEMEASRSSSVDRLLNRLGLPPSATTEGVASSANDETAVDAQDETQVAANEQQSAFVLPDAQTQTQATDTQVGAETQDSQLQVANSPVIPPASAEVATVEVVSNADGSSLAPSEPEYQVKPGDTLTEIATKHKVSVPEIVSANDLQDPNLVLVNQRIKIPSLGDSKVEKVTVAMLPEVEPAMATNVTAPALETKTPNQAVLVSANSSETVNQLPANSYSGVGGSIVDEVEAPTLSQTQLDRLQAQYAQKLQSDVQKLQRKYYSQNNSNLYAQAIVPRLPAETKSPASNKLAVEEPVNPEFVVASQRAIWMLDIN